MAKNKSAILTCAVTGGIHTPTMSLHLPITPQQVERLIGTIRREYLHHVPFWTARDLERKLLGFKDFYNDQRSHHALGSVTPSAKSGKMPPKVANLDDFRWRSHCRGLYQLPVAA